MKEQTIERRYNQLVTLLNIHPHKTELLKLVQQQIADDTVIVDTKQ